MNLRLKPENRKILTRAKARPIEQKQPQRDFMEINKHKNKITGILIAAGLSSRMGKLKALLMHNNVTFVVSILNKMLKVCDNVVIVLGHESLKIKEEVIKNIISDKVEFVYNSEYSKGMLTSLQAGTNKADDADWILYHFIDQPGLPDEFYKKFIDEIDESCDWMQPRYESRSGHPILIHQNLFVRTTYRNPNGD